MRIEMTYYADDGMMFTTKEECEKYEQKQAMSLRSVRFYDKDLKEVYEYQVINCYAIYAYIENADLAPKAFDYLYDICGMPTATCLYKDGDVLEWDECEEEWYNLTQERKRMADVESSILAKVWSEKGAKDGN